MKEFDSFFNTYNARHLAPQEVAETFIFSENYEKLIQNNHSVILGARGCGKTTLMKMLTLPALHSWQGDLALSIRDNIPFYAIYISTDIYWDVKNQTYNSQLEKFGKFSNLLSEFSVNSNVFKSITETFRNIINYELKNYDEDKEVEFCKHLIKAWKFKGVIPKFEYVIDAINERVDEVNQLVQFAIFNYKSEDEIPKEKFFNLSFESSIELLIPIFERIYEIKSKKKWALCFDELEFAPLWLQEKLFTSLRSRAQYILYKLSASPILSIELEKTLKREYGATPGNDVQIIKMWGSSENENFCRQLIESLLKKQKIQIDPIDFFGSNEIYNKNPDSYKEGSDFYHQMKELIKKDDSFKDFLSRYKINIDSPLPESDEQKDTVFRKIKPIVYYRNYYIEQNKKADDGSIKHRLRSRKTSELYSGIEILSKVCDGNPRWLIGIVNGIISKSNNNAEKKVQYTELFNAAKRFENVIANIPIGKNNPHTLRDILNKIGNFFSEQLLGTSFYMDPKGTFIVDLDKNEVSDFVTDLLSKATSQGAIVLLDAKDDSFDFQIRNQRFKLAYLFSVLYKLPVRKYPAIKLSECLKSQHETLSQSTLF